MRTKFAAYTQTKHMIRRRLRDMFDDLMLTPASILYVPFLSKDQRMRALNCISDLIDLRDEYESIRTRDTEDVENFHRRAVEISEKYYAVKKENR